MDHYATLGVAKTATHDDIKKAYRKLASKHHPDRGGDTAHFQRIQEAYDVLSDDEKRAEYNNPRAQQFSYTTRNSSMNADDLSAMFSHLRRQFNANGWDNRHFNEEPQINKDIRIGVEVELADTLSDHKRMLNINIPGKKNKTVEIQVPRGITNGAMMKFAGLGDDSIPTVPRGDLIVNFVVRSDKGFEVAGIDAFTKVRLNCFEAILGCKKQIESIDGKILEITIPPGTQIGSRFGLEDQGLYNMHYAGRGRLIVVTDIWIPTELDEEDIEALSKIQLHLRWSDEF